MASRAEKKAEMRRRIAVEFFMLTAIDCINISIGPDAKLGN